MRSPSHFPSDSFGCTGSQAARGITSMFAAIGYRLAGILIALAAGRHDTGRYFCSKAATLGLPSPHRFSPGHLEDILRWHTLNIEKEARR